MDSLENLDKSQNLNESTLDELKLVLVSLAKSNVQRLYMLNSYLIDIEGKIIDKVYTEDIPLRDLLEIYTSIRTSVNDMSKLIQQITSDPTITAIIIQSTQVINQITTSEDNILDKDSRARVRSALAQILGSSGSAIEGAIHDRY